jgi:hypothetical protein
VNSVLEGFTFELYKPDCFHLCFPSHYSYVLYRSSRNVNKKERRSALFLPVWSFFSSLFQILVCFSQCPNDERNIRDDHRDS